jgi:hypothetical protein
MLMVWLRGIQAEDPARTRCSHPRRSLAEDARQLRVALRVEKAPAGRCRYTRAFAALDGSR